MSYQDRLDEPPEIEEKYHESDDEDFNPAAAGAEDSPSSSEDEEVAKPSQRKRKRKDDVTNELDSGDEVTIETAKKRRSRKRQGDEGSDEDDIILSDEEGGQGGLIKTRAQRMAEQKERRPLARTDGATVDVDALWAQMSAAPLRPARDEPSTVDATQGHDVEMTDGTLGVEQENETDLVSIRKIYTFAGQQTTEEKEVPRSLLEQHLSDGWKTVEAKAADTVDTEGKASGTAVGDAQPKVRRPLRRPSRFDPNPTGFVKTLLPEHQLTWPRKVTTAAKVGQENLSAAEFSKGARPEKVQKLNVVDKSRLDWTGFVHKEGIAEELDAHGKTKEAYLGRMGFLAGVEAKQEEERLKAKAAS
jgi:hypothetical protein